MSKIVKRDLFHGFPFHGYLGVFLTGTVQGAEFPLAQYTLITRCRLMGKIMNHHPSALTALFLKVPLKNSLKIR